jgi:N-acetylglucosaminyldiphosphoundecaprenol N-acetyl-beta-D-mannosaminyltransferase
VRRVTLLGVRIDLPRRRELFSLLRQALQGPSPGLVDITTVNAECLAIAHAEPAYREALSRCRLNLVDGAGVALALGLKGITPVERVPGRELVEVLAALCRETGAGLFLLGSREQVAREAALRLMARHPGLVVAWHCPPFLPGPQMPPSVERAALGALRHHRPKVVCVALGMPKQELWIGLYRRRLSSLGVRIAIGVGGALDYLAGVVPLPPAWAAHWGLEWLLRLVRQPRKRLGRQVRRLPLFIALALEEALHARLSALDRPRRLC